MIGSRFLVATLALGLGQTASALEINCLMYCPGETECACAGGSSGEGTPATDACNDSYHPVTCDEGVFENACAATFSGATNCTGGDGVCAVTRDARPVDCGSDELGYAEFGNLSEAACAGFNAVACVDANTDQTSECDVNTQVECVWTGPAFIPPPNLQYNECDYLEALPGINPGYTCTAVAPPPPAFDACQRDEDPHAELDYIWPYDAPCADVLQQARDNNVCTPRPGQFVYFLQVSETRYCQLESFGCEYTEPLLPSCDGDGPTCDDLLLGAGAALAQCNADLDECGSHLDTCTANNIGLSDDVAACDGALGLCESDLSQCAQDAAADLDACQTQAAEDLGACTDDLTAAQGDAECGFVLVRNFVTRALMHAEGNGFMLKTWKVEAPDTTEDVIACFESLYPEESLDVMDQGRHGYCSGGKSGKSGKSDRGYDHDRYDD